MVGFSKANTDRFYFQAESRCCSITRDIRDYAAKQGVTPLDAVEIGMAEKAAEFVAKGSEIYHAE